MFLLHSHFSLFVRVGLSHSNNRKNVLFACFVVVFLKKIGQGDSKTTKFGMEIWGGARLETISTPLRLEGDN